MKHRADVGLLLLRVGAGGLMLTHGWSKVMKVLAGDFGFPDPLGIGAAPSLILTAAAEFVGSILVIVGFKIAWAAIPLAFTMFVAAFVHHAADEFGDKEFPLLYALVFVALALTGGGRYSIDRLYRRRRKP